MYKTTGLLLASLTLGVSALAAPGSSSILVDNRFDGKADVFIDGFFSGEIPGNSKATFTTRPGRTDILVLRDGGAVLLNQHIISARGQVSQVRVAPPKGSLKVSNTGRAPLLVSADASSVWISPGQALNLTVTTGRVSLVSKTQDRFGQTTVVNRQNVWVEPGQKGKATVAYAPPVRTGVVIRNRDHHVVRVRVGNRDYGVIQPGAELFAAAPPGPVWVNVSRTSGRGGFNGNIVVKKGAESKVVVDASGAGKAYSANGTKWKSYTYDGSPRGTYVGMSSYSPSWHW